MPNINYLPEHMGHVSLSPAGPFTAGEFVSLELVYTAGLFGIDDSGHLKIVWRTTSDTAKPQFTDPGAANYTTIEASNGAELNYWIDRIHTRPWANALWINVGRGFLREGDTITVRLGDSSQGSPGYRLQTNVEDTFEFKVLVDALATAEFTELPVSPVLALQAGPAARWKALLPSQNILGESFRLCVVAEDQWGNPTAVDTPRLRVRSAAPVAGGEESFTLNANGTFVINGLIAGDEGLVRFELLDESGTLLCHSTPMRVVSAAGYRHFWGDLHAQSEETIGTNSARDYFIYARDKAFLDIVGHQGNDFQITDDFWQELNALTGEFERPGQFLAIPGYEWSGNTGLGGDRNVFYRHEGRPIRRSSGILIGEHADADCHTAQELFAALDAGREDAVVIAHVGGRYANLAAAHDGRFERSVEIHSSWGTFEWLLHDAFDLGYRPGVICHSDDHKGRPGATLPGASSFGAIGGLTCYLLPELTRDALFTALRQRRHYGTTGTRLFLAVNATFDRPVTVYDNDPALGETVSQQSAQVTMGAIVSAGGAGLTLEVEAAGSAPIERVDIFHGKAIAETFRPYQPTELGRRVRVLWSGAEYRGRGREVHWKGAARLEGNRAVRVAPINFLNPLNQLQLGETGRELSWQSVTTGNMAGFDLWLDDVQGGELTIETNIARTSLRLSELGAGEHVVDAGGLERRIRIYRLPEQNPATEVKFTHRLSATSADKDIPVYVRVTQEDGHQAWSSPIYLI